MLYGFLADVVGLVHLGYVSFVVIGQLLVLVGMFLRWRWIRNIWFRVIHLLMILIVALESLGEVMCPFTTWENQLRLLAGQTIVGDSFVANLLNNIMFIIDPDHWVFKSGYVSFAAIVIMTFILAPPRRRNQGSASLDLDRGLLATTLLTTLGFIFLFTAWCMADYGKNRDDNLAYFVTFTGMNFLGLALLSWSLKKDKKEGVAR